MGPDQTAEVEQPLTPEQQQNLDAIDKLAAKDKELGGRFVVELGKGNNRFVVFRHTGGADPEKPQGLILTSSGFKILESHDLADPDIAKGVVNHIQYYAKDEGNAQQWKYDERNGQIINGQGNYFSEKSSYSQYTAKLVDGDSVGPDVIKDLISYNRKMAETPLPEEPKPVSASVQVVQDLDKLLG